MATHQQYKNFVKKYNSEFGFRGYSKLRKQELINKIESVLNKSRKEIKDEYKKLKEMKKEVKPKPIATPKTAPKKIIYNENTLQKMFPQLTGAPIASGQKKYTKEELKNAYEKADKVLSGFQAREWKEKYENKYKIKITLNQKLKEKKTPVKKPVVKKPIAKKEPIKKPTPKETPVEKTKAVPKKLHNKYMKELREKPINQKLVDKLDKPNINITKIVQVGFSDIVHFKQDGIKMTPLTISMNVSNPDILKSKPLPPPRQTKEEKMKVEYLTRYAYMVGDLKKNVKFTESDLKLYYVNIDKHLKGVQLSEWKRVYNDKKRVGAKEKEKLEKEKNEEEEKIKKRMKEKKKAKAKAVPKPAPKKTVAQKQYTNEELNKLGWGTSLN